MSEATGGDAFHIPLHDLLGLEMVPDEAGSGRAEVRMPVAPGALGANGLHGGAIATLVDLACALAVVRTVEVDLDRQSLVTVDMHVRYLGRPRTDVVVARSQVVRAGSQLVVVECKVDDDADHLVAAADFSMMLVERRRPLTGG